MTHFATYLRRSSLGTALIACGALLLVAPVFARDSTSTILSNALRTTAHDPGVRTSPTGAGGMLPGLTSLEQQVFTTARGVFQEVASVQGTVSDTEAGLGPRFNLDSCAGCHIHPDVGGSSPTVNPQIAVATKEGATNEIPAFLTSDGPIREVRFKYAPDGTPDGGVHAIFTITGRHDAGGCSITQPNFERAAARNNLSFRIPTPTFGTGLIEAIEDDTILANAQANGPRKRSLGIRGRANTTTGRPNTSGNDGTVTRFGWKAQNKSLEIFSGEAYNVEQGVTSEMFPQERDETPGCLFNHTPESVTHFDAGNAIEAPSDVVRFAVFMRFLAAPTPAPDTPSTIRGRKVFGDIGCALCHTPTLHTGKSSVAALRDKDVNLYSDLLLHNMGPGLADEISQGNAGGDEFRSAPLWGLGQRVFFLHDGRTKDLLEAIQAHASHADGRYPASEATAVVAQFNRLSELDKQNVLNFLRSL